ncbi:hypothetical protein EAE96_005755 [Botrytis aclada]|nr:hypothetical protein EAE96_005755 [Botrytis aclada]
MTLDTILRNKMRASKISMLWKCCRCEAAPEALPLYFCKALDEENQATSGDCEYPKLGCGYTSCAICYRPRTKCSNSERGHEKCYGCPSHDGDIGLSNSRVSITIIGGERFALTFLNGYNCKLQCTESSFPNFNVLEGPEPSFWDRDAKDPEPTGQMITRMIPLPRVITNQSSRIKERYIEDETNSQAELKDKSMADPQPPLSTPVSSDRAIQAANTNLSPAKPSQESPPQAPERTDIDKNVSNSLDNLEDISKLTCAPIDSRNLIVAGVKISGSDRTQIGSDSAIRGSSSQITRSDQSKCSEVQRPAFTSIMNTPSSVPIPSADLLPPFSSSNPTALAESKYMISNGQSPQNSKEHAENTSEIDSGAKEGATPVEEKRPPYYTREIAGEAVGLPRPLSIGKPTESVSGREKFSSYSGSGKLKSIRPASPLLRTPTRAPKLLKSMHLKHPAYNPPPTPPPDSPIPPPTPPPEHQQGRKVDRILRERLHRPYGSSPNSPPSRWTPLFQEILPRSEMPNLSTPAVVSQKRPASPAIRPAKIIHRKRRL